MTSCREFLALVSASLDGPLSADEQTRLDQHLSVCPGCRAAQKELKWTHAQLKHLEKVEPPPWLVSKIMARVRAEATPRASFWHRFIRPIVVKPQLQVASILLLAATGFYLLKSQRSEQEVIQELKPRQEFSPSLEPPSKPESARDQVAPERNSTPPAMKQSQPSSANQLRLEDSKPSGNGFAPPPPPPAPAPVATSKEERSRAVPESPHPSETPKPSPPTGAAVGGMAPALAESAAPARQAKKASKAEERPARADEEGRQNPHKAAGQSVNQPEAKDKDKAVATAWVIRLEMANPESAKPLIEQELARTGASVLPQRDSDAARRLWVRLDPRQLPSLLSHLAKIGKVLEHPELATEQPSQITLSIRW